MNLLSSEFFTTLMTGAGNFLLRYPLLAVIVSILSGILLGKIKIGSFRPGSAFGTLLAALILSIFCTPLGTFILSDLVKTIAFSTFVFAIGYEAGPEFFANLRGNGARVALLSLFYGLIVLGTALVFCKILGFSADIGAGIIAGAATQSAILASAGPLLSENGQSVMAVSYAVTYVFGLLGTLIVLRTSLPALFHVKLSQFENDNDTGILSQESEISAKKEKTHIPIADLLYLAAGLGLGLLLGSLSFSVGGMRLKIGSGAASLLSGLLFGYLRRRKTGSTGYQPVVSSFLKTIGLTVFMAGVGLVAGSMFLTALHDMGIPVILTGLVITFIPHLLSAFFGRYVLNLSIPAILGGLSGASTCSAALDGLLHETGNNQTLSNSFTIGYAMGNVVLTLLGPLIVMILTA